MIFTRSHVDLTNRGWDGHGCLASLNSKRYRCTLKLGLFTPVFGHLNFDQMLQEVSRLKHITALELGTGAWPGSSHLDVDACLASKAKAQEVSTRIADAGLTISALSCHGNVLHPVPALAQKDHEIFLKTIRLAEALHVPVVVNFSRLPRRRPEG